MVAELRVIGDTKASRVSRAIADYPQRDHVAVAREARERAAESDDPIRDTVAW